MSTTVTYEGSTIATVNNNTKTLQTAGKYLTDDITLADVSGASAVSLQAKTASPTESSQTIEPDQGYGGLSSVTVEAISSSYVGSGVTRRSGTDLTASGATVTVPAGLYAEQATKSVASGTEGTPVATKGTVSNHAVSVTPSVTNSAGYIAGGTKTGTAVSVSASELVSGSETKTANGTYNVTNLAELVVNVSQSGVGYTVDDIIAREITGDIVTDASLGTEYLFYKTKITSFSAPNMTRPQLYFLGYCTNLKSISFPAVTNVNYAQRICEGCTALTSVSMPNATSGNTTYMFRYCPIVKIALPKFTGIISSNTFRNCTYLEKVDSKATQILNNDNFSSTALNTLVLRNTDMCKLAGLNSFDNTPFASDGTGGTLYVPSALIESYQSATNWSTILGYENNQILPIEGSYYETHYADDTEIST